MSETTTRKSVIERMRDAAVEQIREQQEERSRVADIILGPNRITSRRRVTDVVKLGDDYLVEVTERRKGTARDEVTWTTVVNGKATSWIHRKQEGAILHLIARRYNDNDNSNHAAAFYAGRVLGITEETR